MNSTYTSLSNSHLDPFTLNGILLILILIGLIYFFRNLLEGKESTDKKLIKVKYTSKKPEFYHHWDHTPLPIMKNKVVPKHKRFSHLGLKRHQ